MGHHWPGDAMTRRGLAVAGVAAVVAAGVVFSPCQPGGAPLVTVSSVSNAFDVTVNGFDVLSASWIGGSDPAVSITVAGENVMFGTSPAFWVDVNDPVAR